MYNITESNSRWMRWMGHVSLMKKYQKFLLTPKGSKYIWKLSSTLKDNFKRDLENIM